MKKLWTWSAVLLLAACSGQPSDADTQTEQTAAPEAKVWRVGMSQCNLGEPWRVQMNADIEAAASEHDNLEVIFKDAQNDSQRQRSHIEEFVSQGVDAILVSPLEAAPLTPPIAKAYDAGVPVIVIDRGVLGDKYTVFIGADNLLIGEAAGKWIANKLGGTGKVVELKGLMTSTPGQDRHNGFRKGIEGSDIEVVFEADMKWLEPNARKEMESALAVHEEINLVYGHNDPGAHGAYLAARAAGRADDITFVGIDALQSEGIVYVKQGILDACFEYPTGGREAVETVLQLLNGEDVPRQITLTSKFYTPENLEAGGAPVESL